MCYSGWRGSKRTVFQILQGGDLGAGKGGEGKGSEVGRNGRADFRCNPNSDLSLKAIQGLLILQS